MECDSQMGWPLQADTGARRWLCKGRGMERSASCRHQPWSTLLIPLHAPHTLTGLGAAVTQVSNEESTLRENTEEDKDKEAHRHASSSREQ